MEEANRKLQDAKEILAAERPAVLQHDVVLLLNANPGEFAKHVQPVGQILELHELHLPRPPLLSRNRLECDSSVTVSATAIVEDDVNFLHGFDCAIPQMSAEKSKLHAM